MGIKCSKKTKSSECAEYELILIDNRIKYFANLIKNSGRLERCTFVHEFTEYLETIYFQHSHIEESFCRCISNLSVDKQVARMLVKQKVQKFVVGSLKIQS